VSVSTTEAVYRFKLEADKLDSKDAPDIPVPAILIYLNKAQYNIVIDSYTPDNIYRTGIEGNQKRVSDLQTLEVKDEPLLVTTKVSDTLYTVDLTTLTKGDWLAHLDSYSLGSKGKCSNRILYNEQTTTNELPEVLKDPSRNPSFEWQEVPFLIAEDKLWLYTDGTFIITNVHMDYVRTPSPFDLTGYTKFDGTLSTNSDSELPDYLIADIISMAVKMFKTDIDNQLGVQLKTQELATRE